MRPPPLKAGATVRVTFRTTQQSKAIAAALAPEIQYPAGKKAKARILVRGKKMSLQFYAKDSTTLRAIVSSYLRMLAASLNVSNSLFQLEHDLNMDEGRKSSARQRISEWA